MKLNANNLCWARDIKSNNVEKSRINFEPYQKTDKPNHELDSCMQAKQTILIYIPCLLQYLKWVSVYSLVDSESFVWWSVGHIIVKPGRYWVNLNIGFNKKENEKVAKNQNHYTDGGQTDITKEKKKIVWHNLKHISFHLSLQVKTS